MEGGKPTVIATRKVFARRRQSLPLPRMAIVGQIAKRQAVMNENTFYSVKRFIGV